MDGIAGGPYYSNTVAKARKFPRAGVGGNLRNAKVRRLSRRGLAGAGSDTYIALVVRDRAWLEFETGVVGPQAEARATDCRGGSTVRGVRQGRNGRLVKNWPCRQFRSESCGVTLPMDHAKANL